MRPLMTAAAAACVPLLTDLAVCISACLYKGSEAFCANHENKHAHTLENAAYRFVSKSPNKCHMFFGWPVAVLRVALVSHLDVCVFGQRAIYSQRIIITAVGDWSTSPHCEYAREEMLRWCGGGGVVVGFTPLRTKMAAFAVLYCVRICVGERATRKKLTFDGLFLSYRFVCLSAILRLFW